jgi:hypothetical protein
MKLRLLIIFIGVLFALSADCQNKDSLLAIQDKVLQSYNTLKSSSLDAINSKYSKITGWIQNQSMKLLARMQKKEAALQQKMQGTDSIKAQQLFAGVQNQYKQLGAGIQSPVNTSITHPLKEYVPGLDSMQTAMQFLQQANAKMPGILSVVKLNQIQALSSQVQTLESRMQQANNIQSFIQQREAQLKSSLGNLALGKQLLGMNKQVYYYQQQLQQYKALLNDKKAMETKALSLVTQTQVFQHFMQRHSYFAELFGIPNGGEDGEAVQVIPGLQTKEAVKKIIAQQTGGNTFNPKQAMQSSSSQSGGAPTNPFTMIKSKITGMGGSSSGLTMPDFEPNNQKTKTFLNRLEYGFSIESEKGNSFLPATSTLAVTVGYKLSDKATIGTGVSYILGLGTSLSHIALSNQGAGLRSYLDIKAKGSIWITGGWEYNYYSQFAGIKDIENLNAWQKSALLGVTKKYKVGKQNCNMQLLYDFLYRVELPQSTALQFRLGYSF